MQTLLSVDIIFEWVESRMSLRIVKPAFCNIHCCTHFLYSVMSVYIFFLILHMINTPSNNNAVKKERVAQDC